MAENKRTSLDELVDNAEPVKVYKLEDIPEPPMTCDVPEGWSALAAGEGGDCWYQRANAYEVRFGRRLLPLKYAYDSDGNIVLAEDIVKENE